jgi:hypothetical protein
MINRILRVHKGLFPPETSAPSVYAIDVLAEHAGRSAVVGVLLDRPRVRAGPHIAGPTDDSHSGESEFRSGSISGRLLHQGHRRMDVDVPRFRVWSVHRILHRQRTRSSREDQQTNRRRVGGRRTCGLLNPFLLLSSLSAVCSSTRNSKFSQQFFMLRWP